MQQVKTPPHPGAAYRARRRALGVTQWKIAALASISPYVLVSYELGRGPLAPDRLERLDKVLRTLETASASARAAIAEETYRKVECEARRGGE